MKTVWAIPILASILILGIIGISYDVFAMKNKIVISEIDWDKESQSFVVSGTVHHGIAKAVKASGVDYERADIKLVVSDFDQTLDEISGEYPVDWKENSIQIVVFWDRDNGTFEGPAKVSAGFRFVSTSDYGIAHDGAEIDDFTVNIRSSSACTSDTECNDGISCTEDVCDLDTGICSNTPLCQDAACSQDPVCLPPPPDDNP
ncbi:MAG TPA: hypothetical protein VFG25_04910 [Nitrosopumilaceae archaeon]|nr:hypothetical protein [Nitrosopumilaceae archaeon]